AAIVRFGLWNPKRCNTVVASIGSSPSRTTFRRSEPTPGCGARGHDVLHPVNDYETKLLRRRVTNVSFHKNEHQRSCDATPQSLRAGCLLLRRAGRWAISITTRH